VTRQNPEEELDISTDEEESGLAWGVEVEPSGPGKSVFYSARKVVLNAEYVEIQLLDGKYVAIPIKQVRKVMSIRAKPKTDYTDDSSSDEIY